MKLNKKVMIIVKSIVNFITMKILKKLIKINEYYQKTTMTGFEKLEYFFPIR